MSLDQTMGVPSVNLIDPQTYELLQGLGFPTFWGSYFSNFSKKGQTEA